MSNWFVDTYEAAADAVGSAVSKSFDFLFGDDKPVEPEALSDAYSPNQDFGFSASDIIGSNESSYDLGKHVSDFGANFNYGQGETGLDLGSFSFDSFDPQQFANTRGGGILGALSKAGGATWDFVKANPEVAVGLLGAGAQTVLADKQARENRKHATALSDRQHEQSMERLQSQQEHYLKLLEEKNEDENERYWVQAPTNVDASRLGGRHWATRRNRNGAG